MKAKDTVRNFDSTVLFTINSLLETQAEITGEIMLKQGRREVVEWTARELGVDWSQEENQLKEWRLI